jgi:hypothetical protein
MKARLSALFLSLAVCACSVGPTLREEDAVSETPFPLEMSSISMPEYPPEESLSPLERVISRVRENGNDIPKYLAARPRLGQSEPEISLQFSDLILPITVKADTEGFEVAYYLAGEAKDSGIPVSFTVEEKGRDEVLHQDYFLWRPQAGEAGILLTFDDSHEENWEKYFDLFDRYGARVTFFVNGDVTPFCLRAIERGHDIGYHTLRHRDLRTLDRNQFIEEAVAPAAAFRNAGIPLSSFAYPFGFSEPWMHDFLLDHYGLLRGYGTMFRLYGRTGIRSGYIISQAVDNTVIRGEENFDYLITLMLRTVKFMGGDYVLPLTTHAVSASPWGITARRLEFLLKTASDLKLKFYRYSDFS